MSIQDREYRRSSKFRLIDRQQQIRFAVDVALHSLLFPVFFLTLMILPPLSDWLLGGDAVSILPVIHQFLRITVDNWWVAAFALLFVAYFSVLFSHRIVGPMRRFENALLVRQNNSKEPVHCNLRHGDYFHEFSHLFEEVLNHHLPDGDEQEKPARVSGGKS